MARRADHGRRQVDSSIGGKTGIDSNPQEPGGAFHHPRGVLIDPDTLATLPGREYRRAWRR